jgi:threonine dehydrogenase-like Zn-dependent dehydrogenase
MKALLLTEYGRLSMSEMPVPDVGDDEVLVRVRACGICGSDIHGYTGITGRRIPPLVMGHEAAGVIERSGSNVSDFPPGDRVTFDSTVYCGRCDFCRRGEVNLCDARVVLGVSCGDYRRHGAFAEFVAVPARILHRLPDALRFEHAAMVEALAVAVHAVGRRRPAPSEQVVVIGCGMIGLLTIQVLRAHGCTRIVAVDLDAGRRAMGGRLGATRTAADVSDISTADHAFEVVGHAATVAAAVRCVRKGGFVTLVGNLAPEVPLPLQAVVSREITLFGSCASSGEYPAAIELLATGAVDVAPLISAVAPLEEGQAWFDRLHRADEGLMKVVLQP